MAVMENAVVIMTNTIVIITIGTTMMMTTPAIGVGSVITTEL